MRPQDMNDVYHDIDEDEAEDIRQLYLMRQRAAEELATEFGTDVEEWLV